MRIQLKMTNSTIILIFFLQYVFTRTHIYILRPVIGQSVISNPIRALKVKQLVGGSCLWIGERSNQGSDRESSS